MCGRTCAALGTLATACSTGLGCVSTDVMAPGVGAGMKAKRGYKEKMAKGRPRGGRRSSCRGGKMSHNESSQ